MIAEHVNKSTLRYALSHTRSHMHAHVHAHPLQGGAFTFMSGIKFIQDTTLPALSDWSWPHQVCAC